MKITLQWNLKFSTERGFRTRYWGGFYERFNGDCYSVYSTWTHKGTLVMKLCLGGVHIINMTFTCRAPHTFCTESEMILVMTTRSTFSYDVTPCSLVQHLAAFRRNLLPPSSQSKSKPDKQHSRSSGCYSFGVMDPEDGDNTFLRNVGKLP
jgi:hypothetical protein